MREFIHPNLTLAPDEQAIGEFFQSWRWLLPDTVKPLLFSIFGDLFFESATGEVLWLNTGTGEIAQVADSKHHFAKLLNSPAAEEWFLPKLVEELHAIGKIPTPSQCYSYIVPPVFEEGRYEADNFAVVEASEYFAFSSEVQQQVSVMPDGTKVRFKIVP